jgi:hypothetical protein
MKRTLTAALPPILRAIALVVNRSSPDQNLVPELRAARAAPRPPTQAAIPSLHSKRLTFPPLSQVRSFQYNLHVFQLVDASQCHLGELQIIQRNHPFASKIDSCDSPDSIRNNLGRFKNSGMAIPNCSSDSNLSSMYYMPSPRLHQRLALSARANLRKVR